MEVLKNIEMCPFLLISKIACRLHKSDRLTQESDSRKKAAYAPDDQKVSIVKVTLHAWHADPCEEEGTTHGVSSLLNFPHISVLHSTKFQSLGE